MNCSDDVYPYPDVKSKRKKIQNVIHLTYRAVVVLKKELIKLIMINISFENVDS
ncbi:MAG: hypothetical protein ACFFCE_14110 [Promethearchaeota archaeon]